MYEVTTTHTFTAKDLSDLLITAIEGGSGYWCSEIAIMDENSQRLSYQDETLFERPFDLYADDAEDGERYRARHTLDNSAFGRALELMPAHHRNNFINDRWDAETADAFLQCALFEEIIYG